MFKQRVSLGQHGGAQECQPSLEECQPSLEGCQPSLGPVDQSEQARGLGSGQAAWAGVGQMGSIACGCITGNEGQTRNIIFENPKMGGATEVSRTGRGSAATSRSHRVWPEGPDLHKPRGQGPDLHKPRGQGPDLHKPVTQEVSGSRAKVEPQQPQVV